MEIFKLYGSVLVDSKQADESIKRTDDNAQGLASKLGNALKKVGSAASGIASAAAGAAASAAKAVGSASKAIYDFASETAAVGDNIDKMSQKIGISREAYQELDFICSQSGTSVDNLRAGMKTLTSVMDKTREGTSSTATALEDLGIAVTNSDGSYRDNEEVMWESFAALTKLEDQTEKERLAVELFGKAGTELLPMLNGSADSIDSMRQQAHDLGLVLSDDAVDSSVKFTDTIDQLTRSFTAAKNNLGAAFLPMVQKFAAKLLDFMPKIQAFIEKLVPIIEKFGDALMEPLTAFLDDLLPPLLDIIDELAEPFSNIISDVLPVIVELMDKLLPAAAKLIEKLLPPLVDIFDALTPLFDVMLDLLEPILDVISLLIDPVADILKLIKPIAEKAAELADVLAGKLTDALGDVAPIFETVLGGALTTVSVLLTDTLIPAFDGLLKFLDGDFLGGLNDWGNAFTGVFDGLFAGIDSMFGTHLSEWYDEVKSFWMDVGSNLYEMTHGDEIEMQELSSKYTSMQTDLYAAIKSAVYSGKSAEEAVEEAKKQVLDSSEKLYYFDKAAESWDLAGIARDYYNGRSQPDPKSATAGSSWYADYYRSKEVPKLAAGGLVSGTTLAMVGDNIDAAVNPEVVSPLSDLSAMISGAFSKALDAFAERLGNGSQAAKQPLTIIVQLSDGTELTRALIDNINEIARQDGMSPLKGI